jgi:hypothetical protein
MIHPPTVLLLAAFLCAGCHPPPSPRAPVWGRAAQGRDPEAGGIQTKGLDGPAPNTEAERLVAEWIVQEAPWGAEIGLLGWGPNDERGELKDWLAQRRLAPLSDRPSPEEVAEADAVIRVRYELAGRAYHPPRKKDALFLIAGGRVAARYDNPWGDDWIEEYKRRHSE